MSEHKAEPAFPPVINVNGRNYVWRYELEVYKAQLVRHALGGQSTQAPPSRPDHDVLVPLKIAAGELGVGRRTIGRRMKSSQNADALAARVEAA
jgi:hypothetical protein